MTKNRLQVRGTCKIKAFASDQGKNILKNGVYMRNEYFQVIFNAEMM